METQLPAFKSNIEQAVKFILDLIKNKFKPITIIGEPEANYTKAFNDLYLTDCTASLPALNEPYSFIQKKMNV